MTAYEKYRELLTDFIAIPSISTDPAHAADMQAMADWLQQLFEENSFEVTVLQGKSSNPVIVARYTAGKDTTAMIYGHYDVQPAEMEQGWTGDPFKVREQDGRLIGRGVVDNKGQVLIHIASVLSLIEKGELNTNIIFLIEGNEETSNEDLASLLEENKDLLQCDEVLVSDGEIVGASPTIEVSLRGGFSMRVDLRTAANDMHSGLVGGGVPNAAQELVRIVGGMHDERGKVLIPGFYDGMQRPTEETLSAHAELVKLEPPQKAVGDTALISANDTDFYTQTGLYPTLQVTGFTSGYTGEGFANIVPATAQVRLNVRTVAEQSVEKAIKGIKNYIQERTPEYAKLSISVASPHDAISLNVDTRAGLRAQKLLTAVYGRKPIRKHVGGAIPIVSDFQSVLGVSPLLISLGNDDCHMHGPDENFRIDLIEKGLEFSRRFFGASSK